MILVSFGKRAKVITMVPQLVKSLRACTLISVAAQVIVSKKELNGLIDLLKVIRPIELSTTILFRLKVKNSRKIY